jgi:hypothetical protein
MTRDTPKMTTVDAADLYVARAERELRSALSQIMKEENPILQREQIEGIVRNMVAIVTRAQHNNPR